MQLSTNIVWTVDAQIKDEEKFNLAMEKITEVTFEEEGSMNHEWFISVDGATAHIYERYKDSDAALKHLETWTKLSSFFAEGAEMLSFKVYGDLSSELEQALGGATSVMKTYGGFVK